MKRYEYHVELVWGSKIDLPDDAIIIGVLEDKGTGDVDGETYIAFLTPISEDSHDG